MANELGLELCTGETGILDEPEVCQRREFCFRYLCKKKAGEYREFLAPGENPCGAFLHLSEYEGSFDLALFTVMYWPVKHECRTVRMEGRWRKFTGERGMVFLPEHSPRNPPKFRSPDLVMEWVLQEHPEYLP